MNFDLENYKGPYVIVPVPVWQEAARLLSDLPIQDLMLSCLEYEPENHHNAAVCPHCTPPQVQYENAWEAYVDTHAVVRADGECLCPTRVLPYRRHFQPLTQNNPTVRILCNGDVVKL